VEEGRRARRRPGARRTWFRVGRTHAHRFVTRSLRAIIPCDGTSCDNQGNGNNDVHWVKALVDPSSRDVFAFQPQIVPANRIAVPAP